MGYEKGRKRTCCGKHLCCICPELGVSYPCRRWTDGDYTGKLLQHAKASLCNKHTVLTL